MNVRRWLLLTVVCLVTGCGSAAIDVEMADGEDDRVGSDDEDQAGAAKGDDVGAALHGTTWELIAVNGDPVIEEFGFEFHERNGTLFLSIGGDCGEGLGSIVTTESGILIGEFDLSTECDELVLGLLRPQREVDVLISGSSLLLEGAGVELEARHFQSRSFQGVPEGADLDGTELVSIRRMASAKEATRLTSDNPLDCEDIGGFNWDYGVSDEEPTGTVEEALQYAIDVINEDAFEDANIVDFVPRTGWMELTTANGSRYFVQADGSWRQLIRASEIGPQSATLCQPDLFDADAILDAEIAQLEFEYDENPFVEIARISWRSGKVAIMANVDSRGERYADPIVSLPSGSAIGGGGGMWCNGWAASEFGDAELGFFLVVVEDDSYDISISTLDGPQPSVQLIPADGGRKLAFVDRQEYPGQSYRDFVVHDAAGDVVVCTQEQ